MSSLTDLKVNLRIELFIDDPDYGGSFLSRIMDLTTTEIKLMAPTLHGELVPVRTKTPLNVFYVGDRALYSFRSIVTKRFKEPIPGLAIKFPEKVERIQRREFVRLTERIHFQFQLAEKADGTKVSDQPMDTGYTLDISGGGIKFLYPQSIDLGTVLELSIQAEGLEVNHLFGRVVRCQRSLEESGFEIGIVFDGLAPYFQDKIISWIFDKQRDLRRKGLA